MPSSYKWTELIRRVGCSYLSDGVWEKYFDDPPIEKLVIELIKVHFDLSITTEIMGRRFKGVQ
jgi:hypothetical protein